MSPLKRDDFYYVYILRDIDVTKYDILYTLIYVISLEKTVTISRRNVFPFQKKNLVEKRKSFRWIERK